MSSAFYGALTLQLVAEVAGALAEHADQTMFAAKAAAMRDKYHATFFNATSGSYGGECCQGCHVLPIVLGSVPKPLLPAVTAALVRSLYCYHGDSKQVAITGGGVTTRYIFEALVKVGREDLGLQLATKTTFPSFGYMLAQGPGTIWERWSGSTFVAAGTSSKNHHMYSGGVGRFLYSTVAGISTEVRNRNGLWHRPVVVRPSLAIMRVLGHAAATVPSPWGETSISWKYVPSLGNSGGASHQSESWVVNISTPVRRAVLADTGLPAMHLRLPLPARPSTVLCSVPGATAAPSSPCLRLAVSRGEVT